jgi:hypothetical protein
MLNLKTTPGPGEYTKPSSLSNIRYSMRQKSPKGFIGPILTTPGPGKYESISAINKENKFTTSKFKTYGVAIINPKHNNDV